MKMEEKSFDKKEQLLKLLQRYPKDRVDIDGVILDYIGETGESLIQVLDRKPDIYRKIFKAKDKSEAIILLKTLIQNDITIKKSLVDECEDMYTKIPEILHELYVEEPAPAKMSAEEYHLLSPDEMAGFKVKAIIWQLSDIHFGEYNSLKLEPRELAALIAMTANDSPAYKPDIVLVTGDVSSRAEREEFNLFSKFCDQLSTNLWGEIKPERFVVIPGNHDTKWLAYGTADRLKTFQEEISLKGNCITPFGDAFQEFEHGAVKISRFIGNDFIPSFALVDYEKFELEFFLMVSSYYSGTVPIEVRNLIESTTPLSTKLVDILRVDIGAINLEYILKISKELKEATKTRIALTHHNLCDFGMVPCFNLSASLLLQTLYKKNIDVVFHGHVHIVEDSPPRRPVMGGSSFPIPCPTLSGDPAFGGNRGFSVHLFGANESQKELCTLIWQLSSSSTFEPYNLYPRYRFKLNTSPLNVIHEDNVRIRVK